MAGAESSLKELVKRCTKGDELAWHELLDRISPIIFLVCRRNKLTREQSFDIFGQVSLQLVTNINKLKKPDAITSYVRTITKRLIFDLFRKNRQNEEMEREIEKNDFADLEDNPDRAFERKSQQLIVHDALLSLPSKDYKLLVALFLDKSNLSYEEISKLLNMPVSSIGPSRARSLEKLYRALKKRNFKF